MTRPLPKRGTANGNPRIQPPNQESEHVVDISAGFHPTSSAPTSLLPDYSKSNFGGYNQQSDGGPRYPAYSAPSQPTLSSPQLSLLSLMASETSARTRTSSAQDSPAEYNAPRGMCGARLMTPNTTRYGEALVNVGDNHWQAMGTGYSLFNDYPAASSNLKNMFPLTESPSLFPTSELLADGHPQGQPNGIPKSSSSCFGPLQSINGNSIYRRDTRFLILNDGRRNSAIRVPKGYTLPTNGDLPAPRLIAKGRIQRGLVVQTSPVGAVAAFGSAQRIPLSRSVNTNGSAKAFAQSPSPSSNDSDESNDRPFPVFTKGPMVKSCHQRVKLTQGQINKLSKSKLAALKAEKLVYFHLFPKLPFELRCMIYALMLPDRRIIEIQNRRNTEENKEMGQFLLSYDFPAVFYMSGEARKWAERRFNYKKAFGNNMNGPNIYYDPQRDSLLFENIPLCENFFGVSLNTSDIQGRDRAGLPKHVIDKSKAIEAPLFLAINNAWELDIPLDAFTHLGQPQNIILARPTASAGWMDRDAAKEILEGLEYVAARTRSGKPIMPPKMVCCMTYKQLRNKVEELNRPTPSAVHAQEVTGTINDANNTADASSV